MSGPEPSGRPQVRLRSAADLPECAQLLRDVYASDGYPLEGVDDATGWLMPPGLMQAWVALDAEANVVGHIALCTSMGDAATAMLLEVMGPQEREVAVLARLFVSPRLRGMSIGRTLAVTAAAYAIERHLALVFEVRADDDVAVTLYERMECMRLGETWHTAGDAKMLMYCYVTPPTVPDHLLRFRAGHG